MTLEQRIDELVDCLAAGPEPVDPRVWRRLLIYVPAWLVQERAKKDARFKEKSE